jgi:hypothetical protein
MNFIQYYYKIMKLIFKAYELELAQVGFKRDVETAEDADNLKEARDKAQDIIDDSEKRAKKRAKEIVNNAEEETEIIKQGAALGHLTSALSCSALLSFKFSISSIHCF